jgi:predicted unusual protein kinase regulating ubiquinone biosynthesis (AarF/ABC1/UbiB family)
MSEADLPAGEADAQCYDYVSRGRLTRTAPLVGLVARTTGEAVVAGLRGKLVGADSSEFHARTAERYTELLGRSKGALMKAGQLLSLASAIPVFAPESLSIYQAALARLRNEAPPMAPELAREVLEHEFGRPAESVFAEFDWQPLAAASIGQVHAARLRDGREVAVKVQYPGVAEAIGADLKNTELLITFLSLLAVLSPWKTNMDLTGAAHELSVRISEELDYRLEAATQAEFAERYRGHPFIHVPDVVPELCAERVLTQDLVHGRSWPEALLAEQGLRDSWGEAIFRFIYGSNARFCMVNADPHPGNCLFHDDGSVSFLDFGCVKRFQRDELDAMGAIGNECVRGRVLGTWRACVEANFLPSTAPITPAEVYAGWRDVLELFWREQPLTLTPEFAAKCVENALVPTGPAAKVFRHAVPSPEYTLMIRVQLGAASLIGQLHATSHWQSIAAEYFEQAAPLTEMGKREWAFFEGARVESDA